MTGESVEETIRRAMDYFTELYEESDRGAAILAAATFEHWLESNIIENFVELDQDMRNNLFDNGPLSAFSAKKIWVLHLDFTTRASEKICTLCEKYAMSLHIPLDP